MWGSVFVERACDGGGFSKWRKPGNESSGVPERFYRATGRNLMPSGMSFFLPYSAAGTYDPPDPKGKFSQRPEKRHGQTVLFRCNGRTVPWRESCAVSKNGERHVSSFRSTVERKRTGPSRSAAADIRRKAFSRCSDCPKANGRQRTEAKTKSISPCSSMDRTSVS